MAMHRADPKLRRTAAWALPAAALVSVLGYVLLRQWFAELKHMPAAAAKSQLLIFVAWCWGVMCVSLFALSAYVWQLGAQVVAHRRFPLPGARVVRDVRVVQGELARRYGRCLQAVSVVLLVVGCVGAALSWRAYEALAASAL
jgi:hypothetical protein